MVKKALLPLAMMAALVPSASADCGEGCCSDEHGTACCEDGCKKACLLKPEVVQEEKHCWCTESKEICVPKVVFPWKQGGSGLTLFSWLHKSKQMPAGCCEATGSRSDCRGTCDCALPRCGKIKRVCDLKKEKYEVDVCQWKQDKDACGTGCCCEPSLGDNTANCGTAPSCGCVEPSCAKPRCDLEMCNEVCGSGS